MGKTYRRNKEDKNLKNQRDKSPKKSKGDRQLYEKNLRRRNKEEGDE